MSPTAMPPPLSVPAPKKASSYKRPEIFVHGIGVEYPTHHVLPQEVNDLARRHHDSSPALEKVLAINKKTGIDARACVCELDDPLLNGPQPPTIEELSNLFLVEGVKLSVAAAQQAITSWGGSASTITHIVSTTCTNSANPGFDQLVAKELGLSSSVEKVLLHGVGCAGGLTALRTAANLALGASFLGREARVLVLACEICSTLVRSELESITREQETRIGLCLFSDCASAVVIGNSVNTDAGEQALLEMMGWENDIIDDSANELKFDVHPLGWKVVLTQQVPLLACKALPSAFARLVGRIPELVDKNMVKPADYEWALHPGGVAILMGVAKTMGLGERHLSASHQVYKEHGNSSSATLFSVLQTLLRHEDPSEYVMGCAFGPGVAVEMAVFKRLV